MAKNFTNAKYDVFLSFRGEDTRHTFTSYLYNAFRIRGIKAFYDGELLRAGDEISPSLLKAIEESRISIVVLSKNYAFSPRCLDELVKILDCMVKNHQHVLPIFYKVDPSEVRHQRNNYGQAMTAHEIKFGKSSERVVTWRLALTQVADLSGYHFTIGCNEPMFIENIVKNISTKLSHEVLYDGENIVGLESCVEEMISVLDIFSDNSRTKKRDESIQRQLTELVGIDERCKHIELLLEKFSIVVIWGIGGIGKTTIAKVVFAKFSTQFERCYFFENVREESMKHGLNYLHDKLLYELFKEENPHSSRPIVTGSTQLLRSLGNEKVLIVLDDVDDLNQLEHLTKECNYLGAGSRIIITTRDKNLLASVGVDKIYEVKELNFQESLQLFSLHAFNQNSPKIGYEKPSIKVVVYCKGNPLALKVLGSLLRSKSTGEWEAVLAELEMIPDNNIQDVLRMSYDELDSDHKEIFLDIACFLKEVAKDDAALLLECCDFNASVGIATLLDRALVTISDDNKVKMHDLIQEMGQKIFERCLGESYILWQIHILLNGKLKTHAVEGLLDVSQIKDLHLIVNTFKRMSGDSGLKMLTSNSTGVERSPNVYRCHDCDPLKPLPSKFLAENLVNRCIENADFEEFSGTVQELVNLRTLKLRNCGQLRVLRDSAKGPSGIERPFDIGQELVKLNSCRLVRALLDMSNEGRLFGIGLADTYFNYILNTCRPLRLLPYMSKGSSEIKRRDVLIEEDIFDFGSSFETMKVTDESQLKELPPNLHSLRVVGCHLLESLPDELVNKTSNVSDLYAIDCPSLKNLLGRGNFTSLRTLYIHKCRKLEFLLSSENLTFLEHLCMGNSCDSLKVFTINHCPKLKTLCIWNCPNLESLSISEEFEHGDLLLESLEIRDCPGLISFPTKGLPTPNLMSLTLSNCIALRSLPNHMESLKSLRTIFIDRCPELDSLPEGGLPSSLSLLSIASCDKLIPQKEWELNRLHSLNRFEFGSGCVGMESFPEKDLLPSNLNSLRISNLSSLSVLDYEGLQQLTALQSLDINCCHKLSSIPKEGLPSSLTSLSVKESPLLTRNLMHKLGADWCKIAHIPNIQIDEDFISSNIEEVSFVLGNGII